MLLCFDTETTGVDPTQERVVTAFLGLMDQTGHWVKAKRWLVNPGVPIPPEATLVHGITDSLVQAQGVPAPVALAEMRAFLVALIPDHMLVIYNAAYDLTIMNAEWRRHGIPEVNFRQDAWVIDPMVIDQAHDKYRKGKRTLTATAPVYQVPVESNAHDAGADCLMTGRIALAILNKIGFLHKSREWWMTCQEGWKRERDSEYGAYRRGQTKRKPPADKYDPNFMPEWGWPTRDGY